MVLANVSVVVAVDPLVRSRLPEPVTVDVVVDTLGSIALETVVDPTIELSIGVDVDVNVVMKSTVEPPVTVLVLL